MAWVKLDDAFHAHPKAVRAGLEAVGLYTLSLSYCSHYLTDGYIPAEWVGHQAGKHTDRLAQRLVDVGFWTVDNGGYRVHDYLDYQPSRERILERRAADQRRKGTGT